MERRYSLSMLICIIRGIFSFIRGKRSIYLKEVDTGQHSQEEVPEPKEYEDLLVK